MPLPTPLKFTDTITCHGAPYFVEAGGENSGHFRTGYSMAQNYAKDPANAHVKKIELRSCYGAAGGADSNAQQLANATGAKVTGYKAEYSAGGQCSSPVDFLPQSPNSAWKSATNNVKKGLDGISKFPF
jgi:hypothetical protein